MHDNRIHVSNIPFDYTTFDLYKFYMDRKYGLIYEVELISNERGSKGRQLLLSVCSCCLFVRELLVSAVAISALAISTCVHLVHLVHLVPVRSSPCPPGLMCMQTLPDLSALFNGFTLIANLFHL